MKPLIFALFTLLSNSFVSGDLHLRRSEDSEVTICGRNDICSLVHNPKWGANSVEKLCECPEKPFCPTTYSTTDGLSISVNAWTQMKFCSPILDIQSKLEMCDEGEVAIKVKTIYHIDQVKNVSASMECNCNHDDGPTYWRYHSRLGRTLEDEKFFEVVDNFQCSELYKCNANEFCGFARLDFGFIYQRCTCDTVHDCRFFPEESEVEEEIESELFYSGLMYKSRCIKNETHEHW